MVKSVSISHEEALELIHVLEFHVESQEEMERDFRIKFDIRERDTLNQLFSKELIEMIRLSEQERFEQMRKHVYFKARTALMSLRECVE